LLRGRILELDSKRLSNIPAACSGMQRRAIYLHELASRGMNLQVQSPARWRIRSTSGTGARGDAGAGLSETFLR